VPFLRPRFSAAVRRPPRALVSRVTPVASCSGRRGATLLELAVVLVLLGVMAAVVLPPLVTPAPRTATLSDVVRAARAAALARAQTLQLTVTGSGRWHLHALAPADGDTVAAGVLADAPPLQLQLTPLGACLLTAPVPPALAHWDAAACRPARAAPSAVPEARP
jgi:prepilin-type N-terminal cleavage/methylation domain-containing protein